MPARRGNTRSCSGRKTPSKRRPEGMRVLYWELGVGGNTPVIVKYPFWNAVGANGSAAYACVNLGEACAPKALEGRSILVDGDIASILPMTS